MKDTDSNKSNPSYQQKADGVTGRQGNYSTEGSSADSKEQLGGMKGGKEAEPAQDVDSVEDEMEKLRVSIMALITIMQHEHRRSQPIEGDVVDY